jgi:hypothetical protein
VPATKPSLNPTNPCAILTIPELEHAEASALGTLASLHSRRAYKHAIDKFIAWYCFEPRLGFNRVIVVRYRSFLESLALSAATINLHLSAIRRLADEAAESNMLSPELAIGIRRVKGVKRVGARTGNWLSTDQAQDLLNAIPRTHSTRQKRRGVGWTAARMRSASIGSRVAAIGSDSIEKRPLDRRRHVRQGRTATNGARFGLVQGSNRSLASCLRSFRRAGIQANLENQDRTKSWDRSGCCLDSSKAICKRIGMDHLAPHDLRRTCARLCHSAGDELEQIQFLLGHASVQTTERYIGCRQKFRDAVNDRFKISLAIRP